MKGRIFFQQFFDWSGLDWPIRKLLKRQINVFLCFGLTLFLLRLLVKSFAFSLNPSSLAIFIISSGFAPKSLNRKKWSWRRLNLKSLYSWRRLIGLVIVFLWICAGLAYGRFDTTPLLKAHMILQILAYQNDLNIVNTPTVLIVLDWIVK